MNVGECRGSLVLSAAVSAGAIHLAESVCVEILDGNSSTTVVLKDLV